MSPAPVVVRIGDGVYRVELDGRSEVIYVARSGDDVWVHWNGEVFHQPAAARDQRRAGRGSSSDAHQALSAPMPATVLKVLIERGATVRKGDTLLILEAMKMELPVRCDADGVVRAVHCREGELVQPGAVLVELD
jgi:3-methylcrotonyl-CoA carboxylase alpha subunit